MSVLSNVRVVAAIQGTLAGGTAPATTAATIADELGLQLAIGTGPDQVTKGISATLSIDSAAATTLDLQSILDPLKDVVSFDKILALLIRNKSDVTGEDVTIRASVGNSLIASDVPFPLVAGGNAAFLINLGGAGLTVDATHKCIDIEAAEGDTVPVTVTILGQ